MQCEYYVGKWEASDRMSTKNIEQKNGPYEKIWIFVFNVLPVISAVFVTWGAMQLLSAFLGGDVLLPRSPDVKLIFLYGVLALSYVIGWIVIWAVLILCWSRVFRSAISLDRQSILLHNNLPERSLSLRLGKALVGRNK